MPPTYYRPTAHARDARSGPRPTECPAHNLRFPPVTALRVSHPQRRHPAYARPSSADASGARLLPVHQEPWLPPHPAARRAAESLRRFPHGWRCARSEGELCAGDGSPPDPPAPADAP
eukprot:scaffold14272_cov99-Isochrysis_galbana.AAC.4